MNKKPFTLYLLALILVFQSLGGLFGGLSLVSSPSGEIMKMPVSILEGSPFHDFLVPGLIFLLFLGLLPGILAFALLRSPEWNRAGVLNMYPGIHWASTYSLYTGIMLVIWILAEIIWIEDDILHTFFGLLSVVIVVLTLMPSNMSHFGWGNPQQTNC